MNLTSKHKEEKEILRVYGVLDKETGKKGINWDYGKGINAYFFNRNLRRY